jgi:cytochrome c-type biogenesis protein CcmE
MSRRQKRKLIVVAIVVAVAAVVVFWGWDSTGRSYLGIASLVDESQTTVPQKYVNKSIELQGIVSDWSGSVTDTTFRLVDEINATKSIEVVMTGTFPAGFDNGKTVVAKGHLNDSLPLVLTATEITVGCASKY